jgi:epsilon-lactone hydrolase
MAARLHFHGPVRYRLRSAATLCQSLIETSAARILPRGGRLGWNWYAEVAERVLKKQLAIAFKMQDVNAARCYLDSLFLALPLRPIAIRDLVLPQFRGSWFLPQDADSRTTLLYLHGGGYSFYPRGYGDFIKQIALAAKARTFALDYRLAPEHRFPAQLEDALAAYRWLLDSDIPPDSLVLAGDSAGANLALALLLAARDQSIQLPALAVLLSPPTGFEAVDENVVRKHEDWITEPMLRKWVAWFCDANQFQNPLVSPVCADLRGLPPIYIQAGRAEILFPTIQAFVDRARTQGASVSLESWEGMTHVFQLFGAGTPQSAEALRRIGEVIDERIRRAENCGKGFTAEA